MTHFAIANVQTHVAIHDNIPAPQHRVDLLMHLYPWVQMIVLSELAAHGPITSSAEPIEGETEAAFQAMARRHQIWFVPGPLFVTVPGDRSDGQRSRRWRDRWRWSELRRDLISHKRCGSLGSSRGRVLGRSA